MKYLDLGQVSDFLLLGGGGTLVRAARLVRSAGYPVRVVTSQRHLHSEVLLEDKTLKEILEQEAIEYHVSDNINTDSEALQRISPGTLGLSMGAAWILREDFINRFSGRLLNLHATTLPRDRGGGGFSWRILRGDPVGAALIHVLDPGVDTGDIVKFNQYIFPAHCRTPADFAAYNIEKYDELLRELLDELKAGVKFPLQNQQEAFSSYWPRLDTNSQAYINWSWTLGEIDRFICAFDDPYDGAMSFVGPKRYRIKHVAVTGAEGTFHPFQNGIVFRKTDNRIFVAHRDGALLINQLLDDDGADCLKNLRPGDRFHTPGHILDAALEKRIVYTPSGLKQAEPAAKGK